MKQLDSISSGLDAFGISRTSFYRCQRETGIPAKALLELLTTHRLTLNDLHALLTVQRLTPEQVHAFHYLCNPRTGEVSKPKPSP
jgi:hypothetical protein